MSKPPFSDDPIRARIAAAMTSQGRNKKELSEKVGKNHAYMHQYLEAGTPVNLPEDIRKLLAAELNLPEAELRGRGDVRQRFARPQTGG